MATKSSKSLPIFAWKAVQWIEEYWTNQFGDKVAYKPRGNTVNSQPIEDNAPALSHHLYPGETCFERARRLDILDKWTYRIRVEISANRYIEYSGEKAKSIMKSWKARVYGRDN